MRYSYLDTAMEWDRQSSPLRGVRVQQEYAHGLRVTHVAVESEAGSAVLRKPIGRYITVECAEEDAAHDGSALHRCSEAPAHLLRSYAMETLASVSARHLSQLLAPRRPEETVLVVGLGNWNMTPDALGPKVVQKLLITRHLFENGLHHPSMSRVAALMPGVMGITGMETLEIVRSVVQELQPRQVIVVDALSASEPCRVGNSLQFSDAGLSPGDGVGNTRQRLDRRSLGVPVFAIGMPMVLSTRTIGEEWVRAAVRSMMRTERRTALSNGPGSSSREHRDEHLVQQICGRNEGHLADMVVTPKEIDMLVGWASELIAAILNRALHPFLPEPLLRRYLMEIV